MKFYELNGSPRELLDCLRTERPQLRYAISEREDAIGAWDESLGRFVTVLAKLLTGTWATLDFEVLCNGEPATKVWLE